MSHDTNPAEALPVTVQSPVGNGDDRLIDAWELKAAKRALANLRELLYGQPMLDLIAPQMAEAERRGKEYSLASNGKFTPVEVILTFKAIKSAELFNIARTVLAKASGTPEEMREMFIRSGIPMHPEHYALGEGGAVIETMGGLPTQTHPTPLREMPDFVKPFADPKYPIQAAGAGPLADGTPFTYVLQQFRDTDDGMEASLRVWYPAACPPEYIEEHAEHYAIEFRNACRLAQQAAQG